ncbi:MAG: hypothetical protein MJ131_04110 [Lachnospiraceae bacterium]|nr:hypothetical protein [Lachnospiraceae bacterium]
METAMYQPTKLAMASENIRKMREDRIARKAQEAGRSEGECAAIFERIGDRPFGEVAGIAYCLSDEEKRLMVVFMFAQLKAAGEGEIDKALVEKRVKNYIAILTEEGVTEEIAIEMFKGCQEYYKNDAIKPLFKLLREDDEFGRCLEKMTGQEPGPVLDAFIDGTISEYYNKAATALPDVEGGYAKALEQVGVIRDTALYKECMVYYVVICSSDEYRNIGEAELYNIAEGFTPEMRRKLLINMVSNMDTVQLRKFAKLVGLFKDVTGEKDSERYNRCFEDLAPQYQTRYATWLNQYIITESLGKSAVADFWYNYAGKIAVRQLPSGCLMLEFNRFVVIETIDDNAAYFYGTDYFRANVIPNIAGMEQENLLVDFLKNKTEMGGQQPLNWRRAHIGDWQFPVRDYLSTNMKVIN